MFSRIFSTCAYLERERQGMCSRGGREEGGLGGIFPLTPHSQLQVCGWKDGRTSPEPPTLEHLCCLTAQGSTSAIPCDQPRVPSSRVSEKVKLLEKVCR